MESVPAWKCDTRRAGRRAESANIRADSPITTTTTPAHSDDDVCKVTVAAATPAWITTSPTNVTRQSHSAIIPAATSPKSVNPLSVPQNATNPLS